MKDNIKIVVDKDAKTLIVREGAAQEIRDPKIITITGTIDAPRKYMEKRKSEHEPLAVHVLYSKNDMRIRLNVDEKDHFGTSIIGQLSHNPDYSEFGINKNKKYTIKDLQEFLKMRKFFFDDKDENLKVVANLGKFRASVNTQLSQEQSSRGDKSKSFDVKVDSNIDLSFVLCMPIFKGQPANTFKVEICFDVRDTEISIWLESGEARETELKIRDKVIGEELESFEDYVIIEQ